MQRKPPGAHHQPAYRGVIWRAELAFFELLLHAVGLSSLPTRSARGWVGVRTRRLRRANGVAFLADNRARRCGLTLSGRYSE